MRKKYVCSICGNVVQLDSDGGGKLACCGKEMELLEANTNEEANREKHIPNCIIHEKNGLKVLVEMNHPMDNDHYIKWIKMEDEYEIITVYFKPGDEHKAVFSYVKGATIYAYCNKHGLWKTEIK